MSRSEPAIPVVPAEHFALILSALCEIVAVHGFEQRLGYLTVLIWSRITRIAARFARLIAHGTPKPRKPRPPNPPKIRPERPNTPPRPRNRMPSAYAWLARIIPQTRHIGSQLQNLLAEPEMAEFIAGSPAARRILRPLLNMLGAKLPKILQLPPPKPRPKPAPGEPRHIPKPRVHPICDYQPGPRKDELRAMRNAHFLEPRKIRP